ncbi:MAG: hypothetical protein U1G08_10900 [Verrucomicrobiota bacterium]
MTGLWLLQLQIGLCLFLLCQAGIRRAGFPVRLSAITGIVLAGCILFTGIPVGDLSVAQWVAGFSPGCSIPLLAVLTHGTIRSWGGPSLFRSADLRSLWILGLGLGLILYPASLGWGSWDPYAEGWERSGLFPGVGLVAAGLILFGFRSGYVLLAAVFAWRLGALESSNYWDYLVDPQFFLVALIGLTMALFPSSRAGRGTAAQSEKGGIFSGAR